MNSSTLCMNLRVYSIQGPIDDPLEIANKFNSYFINIGLKLVNSIVTDTTDTVT